MPRAKGLDWEAEVELLRGELTGLSAEDFAGRVGTLLACAQDIHVRVAVTSGVGGERVVQVQWCLATDTDRPSQDQVGA